MGFETTHQVNMSSEAQAEAAAEVEIPALVEAPKAEATKKTKADAKGKDSSSGRPKYKDMVMDAIITQKERSGSSLSAIKNHLGSKYKVDVDKKAGVINSVLKKMREEGVLVAGAQPGRKGAGCFKVSAEEKSRMAQAAKAAAKKLKAQQKQGWARSHLKLQRRLAKASAGKKAGKSASAGMKVSAKKAAVGSKKPVPKSNKAAGKKGATVAALKTNKR